jgi:rhodanese-related sulfurtransferase
MIDTNTPVLPPIVGAQEIADRIGKGSRLTLLDVRTPAEFESAHIDGSYNVPLDQLAEHREALRGRLNRPTVLVCRSGAHAREADTLLREIDPPSLHVLDGGVIAWEQAGLPLRRGRQIWSLERQVRGVAGGLVLASVVGSAIAWLPLKWLAALVGGGLLFSALTDTCAMGSVLSRLPCNRAATCDIWSTLAKLRDESAA